MTTLHYLGLPRIGPARELKWSIERYWQNQVSIDDLEATARILRRAQWERQRDSGADLISVGDFAWYDHILEQSLLLGVVPSRFRDTLPTGIADRAFTIARGQADTTRGDRAASPMQKWFDTNYHYLQPEWDDDTCPRLASDSLVHQIREAREVQQGVKVQLIGPATYLWLSRFDGIDVDEALERLLPVYHQLLGVLSREDVQWVQLDEPLLCLDLPTAWRSRMERAYSGLAASPCSKLLTTYFGGLEDNLSLAAQLPVQGLHVDLVSAPDQLTGVLDRLGPNKVLSAGIINGRNIWRADLDHWAATLGPIRQQLGDRLWVATSCSLLHVPYSAGQELTDTPLVADALAFVVEKQQELSALRARLDGAPEAAWSGTFRHNRSARQALAESELRQNPEVARRLAGVETRHRQRPEPVDERKAVQQAALGLPALPTTTIGSFPQTTDIRKARRDFRQGRIEQETYHRIMEQAIAHAIARQEALGLDVLVHGEPERNDMVEYFGESLAGFTTTRGGWVQSYGTRCVKPPLIYGDVYREKPLTLPWATYAQSLSKRPVKAMLTGPTTMLAWAFVREDQPQSVIADQVGLALRDEIHDLEQAGLAIIQVDEPALREKLPLRRQAQAAWLDSATAAFRLATSAVRPETQIHTHMCYSHFQDILHGIQALDADVITIEAARSEMALVRDLAAAGYNGDIGPGLYDIHSPLIPEESQLRERLTRALASLPAARLWVNPDCGLKTRQWAEVEAALTAMVAATKAVRERIGETAVR